MTSDGSDSIQSLPPISVRRSDHVLLRTGRILFLSIADLDTIICFAASITDGLAQSRQVEVSQTKKKVFCMVNSCPPRVR